ncbi:hypothetical protein AYO40_00505 [Planctomycetaceae bacterium SCGC AG-212-D15]|nr:hypothetical protein AYO40_00505 [Planctomycetaceae bacterium SCGC AG-212-D15]
MRARIALVVGRKVAPLWPQACFETEAHFGEKWPEERDETYLADRSAKPIELISVRDVPRAFVPLHILEMADVALSMRVHDWKAFRNEANEWWEIYGRPEGMEREFFIKWAAQESLYESIGWNSLAPKAPSEHALYAYAGVFYGEGVDNGRYRMDKDKEREFWVWWLSKAIVDAPEIP